MKAQLRALPLIVISLIILQATIPSSFSNTPSLNKYLQSSSIPPRGVIGDTWADVIIGKPDFSEITPNEVTSDHLFNPNGILIDRSIRPNRVYIYDTGNSRVLGLSHLGFVQGGPNDGQPCTSNSDYPNSVCVINESAVPDLVLGQPALTNVSACNGDSGFQLYPTRRPATASTLCLLWENSISPLENGGSATMAVDNNGNLYVPDWENSRILRYNSPFTTDTIADAVWGQDDFSGIECNKGDGIGHPTSSNFCFPSPWGHGSVVGVAIDGSGNLWVTDNQNNRVLRFPYNDETSKPSLVADLVLGQPDFGSWQYGSGVDQMWAPASVLVDSSGSVYVADSYNNRVLIFDPPITSGMSAQRLLGVNLRRPTGLSADPGGGIWVNDSGNGQLLLYINGTVSKVLLKDLPTYNGQCGGSFTGDTTCRCWGGIGIDSDSNVFVTSWDSQEVWRFPSPIPSPTPGVAHSADARLFRSRPFGIQNKVGRQGLWSPRGVEIAAGQLIVADVGRILFWNSPWSLTSGQPADGYINVPDFNTQTRWEFFGRIRADQSNHLWAMWQGEVRAYSLPLVSGAEPILVIRSPLPVIGGGILYWNEDLRGGGLAVDTGDKIWLSDPLRHRVFRISNVTTDPVVDIVIGQTSLSGIECNQGRGLGYPSRDSLCYPGALAIDPYGNLYVSDHALEVNGNHRLLEYDADLFPNTLTTAIFGVNASRVFGTGGSFTGTCQYPLCGPWEPAFDSTGRMVVGFNSYIGSRFLLVFDQPLVNPDSYTYLADFYSMPYAATFDSLDNLYVADLNRARVLIYKFQSPQQLYLPLVLMNH
jgi:hypothetical protein